MMILALLLQASLAERIDAIVAERLPEGARASIVVIRGDRELYARDADAPPDDPIPPLRNRR